MKALGEFFYMGGPLFMSLLSILFLIMVAWMIYHFIMGNVDRKMTTETAMRKLGYGKSIGLFALVTGVLGQLIGLYSAFSYVAQMGGVSPKMMFGGIRVSMISTLYGIFIYLISLLLWFIATTMLEKKLK